MVRHASLFSQLIALLDRKKIHGLWYTVIMQNDLPKDLIHGTILLPCYFVNC